MNKFVIEFSLFSTVMATIRCISTIGLVIAGMKSFKYANLSIYSLFFMLGAVVLPSLLGIFAYNESLTNNKVLSYIFIFIALFISSYEKNSSRKTNRKAIIFYVLVFLLSGLSGYINKIHQSSFALNVDTNSFLFTCFSLNAIISFIVIVCFYIHEKKFSFSKKGIFFSSGVGIINAVAGFLSMQALTFLPVSIHSLIDMGTTFIFSAIVGLMFLNEKIDSRKILSVLFAIVATVFTVL